MQCHICSEPAIGQCQTCWKFYCAGHGDLSCEVCRQRESGVGVRGAFALGGSRVSLTDSSGANAEQIDEDEIRLGYGIPRARVLTGVLPLAEVRNIEGGEISLISLESYEDGFRLLWRIRSDRPQERSSLLSGGRHPSLLFGQATDDLGNAYTGGFPGGGGGSDTDWRGEALFTPAVADAAARLTLRIEEIQWMSWSPAVRSSAEIGPWVFEVPLENITPVTREQS